MNSSPRVEWWVVAAVVFLGLAVGVAALGERVRRPLATEYAGAAADWPDYAYLRKQMVQTALEFRSVLDPPLLEAFRTVPREKFVPADLRYQAYWDVSVPVPGGFVLQPYALADMLLRAQVHDGQRVLVMGSASGYEAAVAARLGARVEVRQVDETLVELEARRLRSLGYDVPVHRDLAAGVRYDAILVLTPAAAPEPALLAALDIGGRLVMARKEGDGRQRLWLYVRESPERVSEHRGDPFQLAPQKSVAPARAPRLEKTYSDS